MSPTDNRDYSLFCKIEGEIVKVIRQQNLTSLFWEQMKSFSKSSRVDFKTLKMNECIGNSKDCYLSNVGVLFLRLSRDNFVQIKPVRSPDFYVKMIVALLDWRKNLGASWCWAGPSSAKIEVEVETELHWI